jgi:NADPH-dependent glutamate synthase beta subunit-like oxidoreductase
MNAPGDSAQRPSHVVAVIGGATAGAEVAGRLADRGARVVVFEQNPRPFGKIEDGLPRWHVGLRRKEYETISEKLARPGVEFVPLTRVGRDLSFDELARAWGFSAVVLACGAWRDRPLPIEDAERWVSKGLVYQNPFIVWFNHAEEAGYSGPRYEPLDRALVIGGGLASIDVVKVLMLETTRAALRARGIEVPLLDLEVKGIPKGLEAHGLAFADLGLAGCTLFYRRRAEDMPLVDAPEDATPERIAKVRKARVRVLEKAMEKYLFRFEPLAAPERLLVEDDRVVGLRLRRTRVEGGRVLPTDELFERRGSCVISSIGSIPEPIAGIPLKGELFDFSDGDLGRLDGYPNVFSVGNVVTGKGNIVASRKHAAHVAEAAVERFLGLGDEGHAGEAEGFDTGESAAREAAERVATHVERAPMPPAETVSAILARVRERQRAVGYGGDYRAWIARVAPPDMA